MAMRPLMSTLPMPAIPTAHLSTASLRRHDLVRASDEAWRAMLAARGDLRDVPLVAEWVASGWPLVVRRTTSAAEAETEAEAGVALGLPLPPSAGKRRIAVTLPERAVLSVAPPPHVTEASTAAPASWMPTLDRLAIWGDEYGVQVRVYGSLAWQWLTGQAYVSPTSDVDLLLGMPHRGDLRSAGQALAAIDAAAPMRLDGEWVNAQGAAVNWREWQSGAAQVLVKTLTDVSLQDARRFHDDGGRV